MKMNIRIILGICFFVIAVVMAVAAFLPEYLSWIAVIITLCAALLFCWEYLFPVPPKRD